MTDTPIKPTVLPLDEAGCCPVCGEYLWGQPLVCTHEIDGFEIECSDPDYDKHEDSIRWVMP